MFYKLLLERLITSKNTFEGDWVVFVVSIDQPTGAQTPSLAQAWQTFFLLQKGFKSNLFQVELVFWFFNDTFTIQNKYLLASKCLKWFYLRQTTIAIGLHFLLYPNHSNFILRQSTSHLINILTYYMPLL